MSLASTSLRVGIWNASASTGDARALDQPVGEGVHQHGAPHHEHERRVPRASEVEEAANLVGRGHPTHDEARPEEHAGEQAHGRERGGALDGIACVHGVAPVASPRIASTAIAPVVMNVSVAASDRPDMRLRPQTPCPLVQPLPRRVPTPTSKPATTAVASPGSLPPAATREEGADEEASRDQAGDEEGAPHELDAADGLHESVEDTADPGDPTIEHEDEGGADPDQRASDGSSHHPRDIHAGRDSRPRASAP
jgi:hypothetical protein